MFGVIVVKRRSMQFFWCMIVYVHMRAWVFLTVRNGYKFSIFVFLSDFKPSRFFILSTSVSLSLVLISISGLIVCLLALCARASHIDLVLYWWRANRWYNVMTYPLPLLYFQMHQYKYSEDGYAPLLLSPWRRLVLIMDTAAACKAFAVFAVFRLCRCPVITLLSRRAVWDCSPKQRGVFSPFWTPSFYICYRLSLRHVYCIYRHRRALASSGTSRVVKAWRHKGTMLINAIYLRSQ